TRHGAMGAGYLAHHRTPSVEPSIPSTLVTAWISTELYPVSYRHEKANLYGWDYNTQPGGIAWANWNLKFQDEITRNQSPDGNWARFPEVRAAGNCERGSGMRPCLTAPISASSMLEVSYRYVSLAP